MSKFVRFTETPCWPFAESTASFCTNRKMRIFCANSRSSMLSSPTASQTLSVSRVVTSSTWRLLEGNRVCLTSSRTNSKIMPRRICILMVRQRYLYVANGGIALYKNKLYSFRRNRNCLGCGRTAQHVSGRVIVAASAQQFESNRIGLARIEIQGGAVAESDHKQL